MFPDKDRWPQGSRAYSLTFLQENYRDKFLEELKSHSSNWIKTQNTRYKDFYWQGGYGAFSVSPQYIESQHEHHKTTTFQDEYRRILHEHNVEFEERYVWD